MNFIQKHMEQYYTENQLRNDEEVQITNVVKTPTKIEEGKDEKIELLLKKNVSRDKEVKIVNLALKQSETEKVELKKQIIDLQEAFDIVVKENTVLNEVIKAIRELTKIL